MTPEERIAGLEAENTALRDQLPVALEPVQANERGHLQPGAQRYQVVELRVCQASQLLEDAEMHAPSRQELDALLDALEASCLQEVATCDAASRIRTSSRGEPT